MHPITTQLAGLQRRLQSQRRIVAACWTLAVVVAAAILLGLTDYLVRFADRGLRLMVTAALAAAATWAVYRWWIVPRRERIGPLTVARRIEARFPELRDRLASAVEFLRQSETDAKAGSAALRRAVVTDAELAVGELPLDSIVDRRPLRRATTWAAIAAALVVLLTAIDATAVRTAAVRLVTPLGTTEWPRTNHLEFRNPPTRLAAGQVFEVELLDRGGTLPEDVRIEYRFRHDGRRDIESEWMARVGDVMVARRDDLRRSFAFRATGGDDQVMRWHEVEVVEPPQLASLSVMTHPPDYTGLAAAPAEGHLEVLDGTGIEVTGVATEPLDAARVIVDGEVVDATIRDDTTGQRRGFRIAPDKFIAAKSGSYHLELENTAHVSGTVGSWNLRVESDPPPSVAWRRPQEDLYVLPTAVVPLSVDVLDNLAVAAATLQMARSDRPGTEDSQVEMYRGPKEPSLARDVGPTNHGNDAHSLQYELALAPMALSAGTHLALLVEADDYRPGSGRTATARRVTIITPDELDARLADQQAQIARRLEEILRQQRSARDEVQGVEIQLRDSGSLLPRDEDSLQAAELGQRRLGRALADRADGVPALAAALLEELEVNGIEGADVREQMENLAQAVAELAAGPLATAELQLTAARKIASSSASANDAALAPSKAANLAQSLEVAVDAQDQVILVVEKLVKELGGSADYGELVRDLAQLREDQLAHRDSARDDIRLEMLPLEFRELSREERATLNRAAAAQDALTRRYQRLNENLHSLAETLSDNDSAAAQRLADAADLARDLAIESNMRQASRELSENRVGTAIAREQSIADGLQELIDLLRDRRENRPEQLAEQLRVAERELAALRTDLAKLREAIARAEQNPAAAQQRQLETLRDRQQQIRQETSRLARGLTRLQAADASRSIGQAAGQLADRRGASQPPRPASSSQIDQAERHLADAAQALAEQRRQQEELVAMMMLRHFQGVLATMVAEQTKVIDSTVKLNAQRSERDPPTDVEREEIAKLTDEERQLADEAHVQSEMLTGLRVFETALEEASTQLSVAADQLEDGNTGDAAQRAERRALARLEQIVWALEQTAAEASQSPNAGAGSGNAGAGQPPRPMFDLFEVKLLRMLQVDLNQRTEQFERESADVEQAARRQEADHLAAEQGHLAELVQELMARNNKDDDDE